jgi:hypothetical protein
MPITEQEARCIDVTCNHLATVYGGDWCLIDGPSLDDLYPSEPSPEVIVGNGCVTAAVEVKRLTGDSVFQAYKESIFSLHRSLVPSCGGYYWLNPPQDFRLPMSLTLRREVKKEIERVAPMLAVGEAGPVRIRREAHIALTSESGPPYIYCHHDHCGDLLRPLLDRITGQFFLVDEGLEHSFVTDEGREAFYDAVARACQTRLRGNLAPVTWYEEWELTRGDNDDDQDGVEIITVTEARDMYSSVAESVYTMLEKGQKKFTAKRWADRHVLVLETSIHAPARLVTGVVRSLEPEELEGIDLLLLVDGDELIQCYPGALMTPRTPAEGSTK